MDGNRVAPDRDGFYSLFAVKCTSLSYSQISYKFMVHRSVSVCISYELPSKFERAVWWRKLSIVLQK